MTFHSGGDQWAAKARDLIASVQGRPLSHDELTTKASELAVLVVNLAHELQTPTERQRAQRLVQLMDDPQGLAFGQALTDRVARPRSASKRVQSAARLLRARGIPHSFPALDRLSLQLLRSAGQFAPGLAAAGLLRRIRQEIDPYLISASPTQLGERLLSLQQGGLRINVNRLGEEVLSEADAREHCAAYLDLLAQPEVTTISVKISAICSHITVLSWNETLTLLREALGPLYRAAAQATPPKLVYLDMESYRDLELNLAVFQSLLSEPDLLGLTAGVVLQAYIPESASLQRELVSWAQARVARGGAPIRLRIAKGANLGMERVESSLRNWVQPTFASKHEVDANYKRLLQFGSLPENARAVHLGIASHNLFDIAYGALLRSCHETQTQVGFELLQGMANSFCRALQQVVGNVLVYAPTVSEDELTSAIAYLVRRLDETSSPENFLRHSLDLSANSSAFERERQKFLLACAATQQISEQPKRDQDRRSEAPRRPLSTPFQNEPDTDFSRPCNREWIQTALSRLSSNVSDLSSSASVELQPSQLVVAGTDPSRPGHVPYRYRQATREEIARTIERAEQGFATWRARSSLDRANALLSVADGLRRSRAELIACMVCDSGKRVEEGDTEVSEAIDFAEYYARSLLELDQFAQLQPRGITVVTPPWNFPLAIPLGGALAALVAGNSVILKPAPETVLVAHRAAHVLWDAGIPRDALQLVATDDDTATRLITDERVATVILTGATSTALHFRALRPRLHLCAETGGKNALIVTAFADRELAIRDVLTSAFGHAGQKCSAASLLVLEADLYDDPKFLEKLRNAGQDLVVGSAWDSSSFITPLIRPAAGPLQRVLTQLDDGESWLVEPRQSSKNPQLWSAGIKLGTAEGSFSHTTECFGPVLAVMRAEDLEHAVRLANGTPYGLTAGLHSLDEQEQQYFLSNMQAGNLYVNRTITGAIVARQPFGGRKASRVGPGLKAGGPNYIVQLMRADSALGEPNSAAFKELTPSIAALLNALAYDLDAGDQARLQQRAFEYQNAFNQFFRDPRDPSRVLGQDNWLRYQPWPVLLRVDRGAAALDLASSILAAHMAADSSDTRVTLHLSVDPSLSPLLPRLQLRRAERIQLAPASIAELPPYLSRHSIDSIRALGAAPDELFAVVASTPIHVACDAVCAQGRIELLHYLREQSCSITTHRYGHLPREKLPPL